MTNETKDLNKKRNFLSPKEALEEFIQVVKRSDEKITKILTDKYFHILKALDDLNDKSVKKYLTLEEGLLDVVIFNDGRKEYSGVKTYDFSFYISKYVGLGNRVYKGNRYDKQHEFDRAELNGWSHDNCELYFNFQFEVTGEEVVFNHFRNFKTKNAYYKPFNANDLIKLDHAIKIMQYSTKVDQSFYLIMDEVFNSFKKLLSSFGYGGQMFIEDFDNKLEESLLTPYSFNEYVQGVNKKDIVRNKRKDFSISETNKYSLFSLTMLRKLKKKYPEEEIRKIKKFLFNPYEKLSSKEKRIFLSRLDSIEHGYGSTKWVNNLKNNFNNLVLKFIVVNASMAKQLSEQIFLGLEKGRHESNPYKLDFYGELSDYVSMCISQKIDPLYNLSKSQLRIQHDEMAKKLKYKDKKATARVKALEEYKSLKLNEFNLLKTYGEFSTEGNIQHNCVFSYINQQKKGKCGIFSGFIDESRYTLEINFNNERGYFLKQMMAKYNTAAPVEHRKIILDQLNEQNKILHESNKISEFIKCVGCEGMKGKGYIPSDLELELDTAL